MTLAVQVRRAASHLCKSCCRLVTVTGFRSQGQVDTGMGMPILGDVGEPVPARGGAVHLGLPPLSVTVAGFESQGQVDSGMGMPTLGDVGGPATARSGAVICSRWRCKWPWSAVRVPGRYILNTYRRRRGEARDSAWVRFLAGAAAVVDQGGVGEVRRTQCIHSFDLKRMHRIARALLELLLLRVSTGCVPERGAA